MNRVGELDCIFWDVRGKRKKGRFLLDVNQELLKLTKVGKNRKKSGSEKNLVEKAITTRLIWVEGDNLDEISNLNIDVDVAFRLLTPDFRYVFIAEDCLEKMLWIGLFQNVINNAIKTDITATAEIRNGIFIFSHGSYRGSWLNGKFHGEGVYSTKDGDVKYDGHWHSIFKAGYGKIMENRRVEENVFWDYNPDDFNGNITWSKKKEVANIISGQRLEDEIMTETDIHSLISMEDCKELNFVQGDVILVPDEGHNFLYRIKQGSVKIEVIINNRKVEIYRKSAGSFFGIISYYEKNDIPMFVVATSDTIVYSIPIKKIEDVCAADAAFSQRFHHQLAVTLANTMQFFYQEKLSIRHERKKGKKSHFQLKNFLDLWKLNELSGLIKNYFNRDCIYRDPFSSEGLLGFSDVHDHLAWLFSNWSTWEWTIGEIFTMNDSTYTVKTSFFINQIDESITGEALILVIVRNNKVSRLEIFYDRSGMIPMVEKNDRRRISPREDVSELWELKDFNLPSDEIIIKTCRCNCLEKQPSAKSAKYGTLYITTNYMCYRSRSLGLLRKETIEISNIKSLKKKDGVISIRLNRSRDHIIQVKHYFFCFPMNIDMEDAYRILFQTINPDCRDQSTMSPRAISKEGLLHKYVRCFAIDRNIPDLIIHPVLLSNGIRLSGPNFFETALNIGEDVCAQTVSTYPYITRMVNNELVRENVRQGDPTCDQFCLERYHSWTIIAVADGCNWGIPARDAARISSKTFVNYVKYHNNEIFNAKDAARIFLKAISEAHDNIIGGEEKWWECGTTTLLGGILAQIEDPDVHHSWAFICASVGDCKAYHISCRDNTITEICVDSRSGSGALDARDSGGRIGPYKDGDPDLRNLNGFFRYLEEGDYVMVVSDGVYDNFDPQHLGISPSQFGIEYENWVDIMEAEDPDEEVLTKVGKVKETFSLDLLHDIAIGRKPRYLSDDYQFSGCDLSSSGKRKRKKRKRLKKEHLFTNIQPSVMVDRIIEYCLETTRNTREFMENNPNLGQPKDYKEYPGKMDHTTCVIAKACTTSLKDKKSQVENKVLGLKNPVAGINNGDPIPGEIILDWLHKNYDGEEQNENVKEEGVLNTAQDILNFNLLRTAIPNDSPYWDTEFNSTSLYQFRSFDSQLSESDWELIILASIKKTYQAGDIILSQCSKVNGIYNILSGTCKLEKRVRSKPPKSRDSLLKVVHAPRRRTLSESPSPSQIWDDYDPGQYSTTEIAIITTPESFGVSSFLTEEPQEVTVIAESEFVELLYIEKFAMEILFSKWPSLGGRFYHFVSYGIARRLSNTNWG
eukprot:TRINITY_DN9045_c0_g1_i1.p1 TRINITY_DN9045_c0_g1~~TRINITY_DN9045_c0_g1_i1.p1  ORF type:complete len:1308 (+),score=321.61 TRINITY_DN9045_c0_g1_i1:4304-8227(+)